jgi:hypothetical protein
MGVSARVITVLRESDHKSRYSVNECRISRDGKTWRADWTDGTLRMELLKDKLVAAGADPVLVDEFRDAVSNESFQDGVEAGQGS